MHGFGGRGELRVPLGWSILIWWLLSFWVAGGGCGCNERLLWAIWVIFERPVE